MALIHRVFALVFLCLLLLHNIDAYSVEPSPSPSPLPSTVPTIDCGVACATRCSKTKRPNLCQRACGSCCFKCKCVPPGTSGNYEACPCYFNLTTRNNIRKCP